MTAADHRTELLYAADAAATLDVAAETGSRVFYTTDGTAPATEAGGSTKALEAGATILELSPSGNKDETVTVRAIAVRDGKASEVSETSVDFVGIPEAESGTKTYIGEISRKGEGQSGGPYKIKVRVTTTGGVITSVDTSETLEALETLIETDDNAYMDYCFRQNAFGEWNDPETFESKVIGKTLAEVINMKTVPNNATYNVDAVTGATIWSDSLRYGVIAALRTEPVSESDATVSAPTLSASPAVAPNEDHVYGTAHNPETIDVIMKADEGLRIHYTTDGSDPTVDDPVPEEIDWYGNLGVTLSADPETHPDGQIIEVRAAAFDADGTRSDVVRGFCVFANAPSAVSYEASYGDAQATVDGVTATVTTENPNFDGNVFLTNVKVEGIDAAGAFVPELLSRVYLAQGTQGVEAVAGYEAESEKVLAAIQAALDQITCAAVPTITLSPTNDVTYANDTEVTVTLDCATEDAQIYYCVDNSNDMGYYLSDPTETGIGTLYTEPFTVSIDNEAGGELYIRAAARIGDDEQWSEISDRETLTFAKAIKENTFVVDGTGYTSWNEAAAALESASDKTLTINDDVELTESDLLPSVACTITSGEGGPYELSGGVMDANADLTFDNLTYSISRIYANGHDVTVNGNVTTTWNWSGYGLYGGGNQKDVSTAGCTLTINAGEFEVYASGVGSTLTGNVTINAGDTADVDLNGASFSNGTVNGNVTFNVDGSAGLTLSGFMGEQNGGTITGELLLTITGSPTLSGYSTYTASVNKERFGTLDLSGADASFDASSFANFKTIIPQTTE